MSPQSKLTAKYDDERSRIYEQSQLAYLQGQIDELRRLIKDQTSKYNWVMEQTRKTESTVAQMQGMFESLREDTAQSIERSRRDIIELRKEVSNALLKIDEGIKPLRDMQSQIQQLADARRQDREQVTPWFARIEGVEQHIPDLRNQLKESEERQRQLAMQLERLREADNVALQEVRRVSEDLLVEKQAVRRQIVETQQLITNWDESLHEQDSRIERVEKLHEQLNLIADTLPPQISELRELITTTAAEIKRVELAANDWFMMSQERAEEIRQQWNQRLEELQDVDVQHLSQVTAWLERLDSWVRELEQRIGRHVTHLETADHAHRERLTELERRELHVIRELSEAVQKQFTFVHAAHVEQRNQD